MDISSRRLARITGVFYFLIIFGGLYGSLAVRGTIFDLSDPGLSIRNLIENESLYRIGFMSDMVMVISDLVVSILFYFLLRPVSHILSLFAAAFRLLQSSVLGANLVNLYKPLLMIAGSDGMDASDLNQLGSEVILQLGIFEHGYLISGMFFAINCLIMAYLLYKSDLFPRVFGIMILAAGIGYLFNCLANFLFPSLVEISQVILLFTAIISELALCLYLLIKGTRKEDRVALA
jgi:hypothetical protein